MNHVHIWCSDLILDVLYGFNVLKKVIYIIDMLV